MGGVIDVDITAYDLVVNRLGKPECVFKDAVNLARYFMRENKGKNA